MSNSHITSRSSVNTPSTSSLNLANSEIQDAARAQSSQSPKHSISSQTPNNEQMATSMSSQPAAGNPYPIIYIAGDSTAAIKGATEKPMSGWGEYLQQHVQPEVVIRNYAVNGRSTRSFLAEGRLEYIADQLKPGDYVCIQFGHNDGKIEDPARYADPEHDYPEFLQQYITAVRSKGATPILLTSVSRRYFLENGQLDPEALGPYPAAMRQVAATTATPLVDVFEHSQQLYRELGEQESISLFMHLQPGTHPNYPNGITDNTHFSEYGAARIAELITHAIHQHPDLTELVKLFLQPTSIKSTTLN